MILKSLKIENYKCIEDSGEFSIAPITCLVGKNESGKTATLQSLYKLKPDIPEEGDFIPLYEYPRRKYSEYKERHEREPDNILTSVWKLENEEIEAVKEILGPNAVSDYDNITLTKGYNNERIWHIDVNEEEVIKYYLEKSSFDIEESNDSGEIGTIDTLTEYLSNIESPTEEVSELITTLNGRFPEGESNSALIDILEKHLPVFLYFDDYYILPGKVSINLLIQRKNDNDLESSGRVFLSLLKLARVSPEELENMKSSEALIAELEAISNRITQKIFEYWSQNKYLEVEFKFHKARPEDPYSEGNIFETRIKNKRHGVTVSFDERSAGFVWFFSFLVWFSQIKKTYGENIIILLDDPALTLHARAQKDLLRYMNEELKPKHQVIYTTHSPFMIDPKNILDVRIIEDASKENAIVGTRVTEDVLSIDKDTLFPLQAALGYDITQTLFIGRNTLLVEGPSDLLYLKWFSEELGNRGREYLDPRWVIAPCGGVSKVGSFVSLFRSNELNVAVFADFHKGIKSKVRKLREEILKKGHVFSANMYANQDEAEIEDLLGRRTYISLVNFCYSLEEDHKIPMEKSQDKPMRCAKEVRDYFRTLPSDIPEYNHYKPAVYLWENSSEMREKLPYLNYALNRFENLFKDLNSLLNSTE